MSKRKPFSSVEELLLKTPLYEELAVDYRDKVVRAILTYDGAVDIYCPGCNQSSTFRAWVSAETKRNEQLVAAVTPAGMGGGRVPRPWAQRAFEKALICTRAGHRIEYYFICESDYLVKVGQYPSIADIEKGDTDKYEPVLGRDRLKEFNRAIGLTAHGVGIGAHVYLRRIFEALVEEAHQAAQKQKEWDEAKYQQSRMKEKIQMLKGFVPEFLTENPRLYGILSVGIHELTEAECLSNFEALKLSIEVILDQKLREKEQQEKVEAARRALANIDGQGKATKA
jgi:hypothetical protein